MLHRVFGGLKPPWKLGVVFALAIVISWSQAQCRRLRHGGTNDNTKSTEKVDEGIAKNNSSKVACGESVELTFRTHHESGVLSSIFSALGNSVGQVLVSLRAIPTQDATDVVSLQIDFAVPDDSDSPRQAVSFADATYSCGNRSVLQFHYGNPSSSISSAEVLLQEQAQVDFAAHLIELPGRIEYRYKPKSRVHTPTSMLYTLAVNHVVPEDEWVLWIGKQSHRVKFAFEAEGPVAILSGISATSGKSILEARYDSASSQLLSIELKGGASMIFEVEKCSRLVPSRSEKGRRQ